MTHEEVTAVLTDLTKTEEQRKAAQALLDEYKENYEKTLAEFMTEGWAQCAPEAAKGAAWMLASSILSAHSEGRAAYHGDPKFPSAN